MQEEEKKKQDPRYETLTDAQKKTVQQFMELNQDLDQTSAISYLEMSNYQIEQAFETMLNVPIEQLKAEKKPSTQSQNSNSDNFQFEQQGHVQNPPLYEEMVQQQNQLRHTSNDQFQQQVNEYKKFLKEKQNNSPNIIKSFLSNFTGLFTGLSSGKDKSGDQFLAKINQKYKTSEMYNFSVGSLMENLEVAQKNNKGLLILIYVNDKSFDQTYDIILKNNDLKNLINKKFQVMGILHDNDELILIEKFIKPEKYPCFACVRRTLFEQAEVIDFETISQQGKEVGHYVQRLEQMYRQYYMLLSEDDKIKKKAQQQQQNYAQYTSQGYFQQQMFYDFPMLNQDQFNQDEQFQQQQFSEVNQEKIIQDRKQIEKTQSEYQLAQKQQKEQEEKKRLEEFKKIQEQKIKEEEEQKKQQELQKKKEQLQLKKQQIPQEPTTNDPAAVELGFKLPNGQKIIRKFYNTNFVNDVFNFIECNENISFQNNIDRQFDLIWMTFPPQSLSDKKNLTLKGVFSESNQEMINIKEL